MDDNFLVARVLDTKPCGMYRNREILIPRANTYNRSWLLLKDFFALQITEPRHHKKTWAILNEFLH